MYQKSINQKRDQLHSEIRKKEKHQFFLQSRMKLLATLRQTSSITNPVELLRQEINVKQVFEDIHHKINSASYIVDTMTLMENGLVQVLFDFLREKKYLNETLETLSFILCKEKLKCYNKFSEMGLLEYLFVFLQQPSLSKLCSYMILRFVEHSDDYCERILYNNKHHILMQELINRSNTEDLVDEERPDSEVHTCRYLLSALENMVSIKESNLDCQPQMVQIAKFSLLVVSRRFMLKCSLGLAYESINKLGVEFFIDKFNLINDLIEQANFDSAYLHNLLAVIFLLIPIDINYRRFFKLAGMVKRVERLLIRIMDRMISSDNRLIQNIPTEEAWWSRLITNPTNHEDYYRMLWIIDRLPIRKEWVWRLYSVALDETNTHKVIQQALVIIMRRISERQKDNSILELINKHQIPRQLLQLQHSKNMLVQSKANQLLDIILGPLTKESAQRDLFL